MYGNFSKSSKNNSDNYDINNYNYAAWFDKKLYSKEVKNEPHIFINVLSEDNYKQNSFGIMQFVNGVNEEIKQGSQIKGIYIVNTIFLNRYYDKKYSNDNEILKRNKEIENLLQKLKCPYKIINWKDLTHGKWDDRHKAVKQQVMTAFAGDEDENGLDKEFRTTVLTTAIEQAIVGKGTKKQTIQFLVEECSVTCLFNELIQGNKLVKGLLNEFNEESDSKVTKAYITYSGKLNNAIQQITKKLGFTLPFIPYEVKEKYIPKPEVVNIKSKKNGSYLENGKFNGCDKFVGFVGVNSIKLTPLGLFVAQQVDQLVRPNDDETIQLFTIRFFKLCKEFKNPIDLEKPQEMFIQKGDDKIIK